MSYLQEESSSSKTSEVALESEVDDNLMIRRTLIKELVSEEPSQKRSLFRIKCKIMDKVCK